MAYDLPLLVTGRFALPWAGHDGYAVVGGTSKWRVTLEVERKFSQRDRY
jgi:hypothetical protein